MKSMKLFEPLTIRGMQLRNRVVMAPMATNFGYTNPVARSFYTERAKGGVAAMMLGAIQIDPFVSDRFLERLKEWVIDPIHRYGAKVGPQLWHGNRYPTLPYKDIVQTWVAPSAGMPWHTRRPAAVLGENECYCRELSFAEIQTIIHKYVVAVVNAKKAGFDFVEVHSAHGQNLIAQFLSPLSNRRTDIYGGDLWGRMRFGLEIARGIRTAVGGDFPIFWRISAEEFLPGGITLEESITYATELEKLGVDVIDVTCGSVYSSEGVRPRAVSFTPGADDPEGSFVPQAEAIKRHVSVAVMGIGGFHSPNIAEDVLRQGKVDLIAIGRQLLADPYWVEKAESGRWEDITPCLLCTYCIHDEESGTPIHCAVNAFLGKEEAPIQKAGKPKKVFVVGGGPAGMEAARVAALRGHRVTLFEKNEKLGGQLLVAEVAAYKQRIQAFIDYLVIQLGKTGAQVKLGVEFNKNTLGQDKPDAVILATGAKPLILDILGVNGSNVVTALDVLLGRCQIQNQKVAILGGGMVGCETAEYLAGQGNEVTIAEMSPRLADDMLEDDRISILYRLGAKGVIWLTNAKPEAIVEEGLVISGNGPSRTIKADKIVLAAGSKPSTQLAEELAGIVPVSSIGDCVAPRRIPEAIGEGAKAALEL